MSINIDTLVKKLLYRSIHRGCKETDIIIGNFAKQYIHTMNTQELKDFEIILEQSDSDIYDWCLGKTPHKFKNNQIINRLIEFTSQNKIIK